MIGRRARAPRTSLNLAMAQQKETLCNLPQVTCRKVGDLARFEWELNGMVAWRCEVPLSARIPPGAGFMSYEWDEGCISIFMQDLNIVVQFCVGVQLLSGGSFMNFSLTTCGQALLDYGKMRQQVP